MYLTKEEERIYDGEYGWADQICMRILVRLGELFNATRLIPIESAHVSGVSYKTLGDAPIEFLEALANSNAKAKAKATINPHSFDTTHLAPRLDKSLVEKQQRILKLFKKMDFTNSSTCTPYHLKKPRKSAHLAWAESSAVVYANSVLGSWTNREGGPSALAAAIIGKTPNYGMHKAENREPEVLIKMENRLKDETDFGALGIFLGKTLKDEIPLIKGLENTTNDCLKQLGAAIATTGMINMYHLNTQKRNIKTETISINWKDIERTKENLTTAAQDAKPDLIFIGCPHCSLNEIKQIAEYIGNKKAKREIELWICTSRHIKEKAKNYIQKIENSGAKVITDTCAVVTWTNKLGIETIMTNSAKTAYYAPTLNTAKTIFAPLQKCLKTALKG